jgi:hypothetical protein
MFLGRQYIGGPTDYNFLINYMVCKNYGIEVVFVTELKSRDGPETLRLVNNQGGEGVVGGVCHHVRDACITLS